MGNNHATLAKIYLQWNFRFASIVLVYFSVFRKYQPVKIAYILCTPCDMTDTKQIDDYLEYEMSLFLKFFP